VLRPQQRIPCFDKVEQSKSDCHQASPKGLVQLVDDRMGIICWRQNTESSNLR